MKTKCIGKYTGRRV